MSSDHVTGGKWVLKTRLTDNLRKEIYDMYVSTYTSAGEELWFANPDQIFNKYCCAIILKKENALSQKVQRELSQPGRVLGFLIYQTIGNGTIKKISLLGHNGTSECKNAVMDKLANLLVSRKSYIIEAAGAVSWILRNRYHIHPIMNIDDIRKALDSDKRKDIIIPNPKFNFNDKTSYSRHTHDGYLLQESLFGTLK